MEKTVLVGVITNDQGVEKSMDYLDELAFLTKTAGGSVYKVFTQKLNNPNQIDPEGFDNSLDDVSFFKAPKEKWMTYGAVI